MSQPQKIILLPDLLCDASTWAAQARALGAYAEVALADFSQLDSIDAMARSGGGLEGSDRERFDGR